MIIAILSVQPKVNSIAKCLDLGRTGFEPSPAGISTFAKHQTSRTCFLCVPCPFCLSRGNSRWLRVLKRKPSLRAGGSNPPLGRSFIMIHQRTVLEARSPVCEVSHVCKRPYPKIWSDYPVAYLSAKSPVPPSSWRGRSTPGLKT